MKIKASFEDFCVEEIINTPILAKGQAALYVLEKRSSNTVESLLEISKKLRIPFLNFGYGGRKDKHALTRQYITIKNTKKQVLLKGKNWTFSPVGFLDRPMGPDLIKCNRFYITIRDTKDEDCAASRKEIPIIEKNGFLNYFDDQRFGTFDTAQGFLAEKILKKHFNGALKIYLTHQYSQDNKEEKENKKFFYENWGKWQVCLKRAKTDFSQMAFRRLTEKPKDFVFLLKKIPAHELTLHFSAYQAYLWNEVLRRLVVKRGGDVFSQKGLAGNYIFSCAKNPLDDNYWLQASIPTVGSKMQVSDSEIDTITKKVLQENNLTLSAFNIKKIRQAYFKSNPRKAAVVPEKLASDCSDDEKNPGKKKIILKFELPPGSYATMFIKRLFCQSNEPHQNH